MVSMVSSPSDWDRVVLDLSRRPLPVVWRDLVARDTTLLQIEQHRVVFQLAVESAVTERALASCRRLAPVAAGGRDSEKKVCDDDAPPAVMPWERRLPVDGPSPRRPVRPQTAPADPAFRRRPGEDAAEFRRRLARMVGDAPSDLLRPPEFVPFARRRAEEGGGDSDDEMMMTPRRPDESTLDALRRLVDRLDVPVVEGWGSRAP